MKKESLLEIKMAKMLGGPQPSFAPKEIPKMGPAPQFAGSFDFDYDQHSPAPSTTAGDVNMDKDFNEEDEADEENDLDIFAILKSIEETERNEAVAILHRLQGLRQENSALRSKAIGFISEISHLQEASKLPVFFFPAF